jgi:hypothetical protein
LALYLLGLKPDAARLMARQGTRFDKAAMLLQSVRPQINPPFQIRRLEQQSFARNHPHDGVFTLCEP